MSSITGTITHEGIESSSNTLTADQMRASLGLTPPADTPDSDDTPETPAEPATQVADTAATEVQPNLKTDQRASEVPPKKKDPQARIDKITFEREEAKREAARVREESDQRIAQMQREFQAQIDALKPKETQAKSAPTDGVPKLEDFADQPDPYAAWMEAKFEHRLKAEFETRAKAAEERRAQHETEQRQFAREQGERERLAGFGQKIAKAIEANPGLQDTFDAVGNLPITRPMADAMIESDAPERIAVYFQQHPEEAARIAALPNNLHQFREITRLEARLETAAPGSAPVVKPKSQAHAPISPVGGAHAAPSSGPPDPKTCTQEEFDAYWNQVERDQRVGGRR